MTNKFDLDLHKRYLSLLLSDIIKVFSEKVAFKGGTCAYFFYKLPRFSFDLDFDVLDDLSDSDIYEIKQILLKNGELKEFYHKKFTLFGIFDYGKGYPNIKIEFNNRVWKNNKYKKLWFLGLPLIIADESTMLTNKLIALSDRKNPVARDLFDVHYFLKLNFAINGDLVKERTNKSINEYLKYLVKFIKKTYTERNILHGLGEAVDEKQKYWIKKYLIKETIDEINKILV